jgi:hypothetical protein
MMLRYVVGHALITSCYVGDTGVIGYQRNIEIAASATDSNRFELVSSGAIAQGASLYISDTSFSNSDMLQYYGYVWAGEEPYNNPRESFRVAIALDSRDDMYQWKKALLTERGLVRYRVHRIIHT